MTRGDAVLVGDDQAGHGAAGDHKEADRQGQAGREAALLGLGGSG
jgi:hypothetical protein